METGEMTKITYAKNLTKQTFSLTISVPIDANVNIKKILNVKSYLFDARVECANAKAVVNGKIGVKVLYVDTDNMTNTISDSQSFNETVLDNAITGDCKLTLTNCSTINNVVHTDGSLKINVDVSFAPVMYLNLGLNNNCNTFENMVVKKSEVETYEINSLVDSSFEYSVNMEIKDNISKILSYDAYFSPTKVTAANEYALIEGKIFSTLVYETMKEDEAQIVECNDVFNVKQELNLEKLDKDCLLDLNFALNPAKENISTEIEDDNNVVTITHVLDVTGVSMKSLLIDVIDDIFSTDNEVELSFSKRDFSKTIRRECVEESVSTEVSLDSADPAIDEILCNLNITPETTNYYLKDGELYFEGIITSQLVYVDENKEKSIKKLEIPFVVNTRVQLEKLDCVHHQVSVTDCKVKAKRGTKIDVSYSLCLEVCYYVMDNHTMVDNIIIGKPVEYGNFDYQIFIAKPNETMWELCKRIRISPDELTRTNKNLPLVMEGGEKVVIKR